MSYITPKSPFDSLLKSPPKTRHVALNIQYFPTLDSTNTYALKEGREGILIIADEQTAGRGRQQRVWHSAPGKGLWFSLCFDGLVHGLTFAAALAVHNALSPLCSVGIKWPNDILLDGKKICGILVEHKHDRTALGIGLNVHQQPEDFPEGLRATAGSLESPRDVSCDRVTLLSLILEQLDHYVGLLKQDKLDAVRDEWAEACAIVGQSVMIEGKTGEVEAIDDIGALIVKTDTGTERFLSGEIE